MPLRLGKWAQDLRSCSEQGTPRKKYIWRSKFPVKGCLLFPEQGHRNSQTTLNCPGCLYPDRDRLTEGCCLGLGLLCHSGEQIRVNPGALGGSRAPGPAPCRLGCGSAERALYPFQCAGPRRLTRRGAAEPSAPATSTGATRSAPSRRARSPASAPGSESLARAMSRRPDSTTTCQARGRCHPSPCLSGGCGGLCICSLAGGGPLAGSGTLGSSPCSASDLQCREIWG